MTTGIDTTQSLFVQIPEPVTPQALNEWGIVSSDFQNQIEADLDGDGYLDLISICPLDQSSISLCYAKNYSESRNNQISLYDVSLDQNTTPTELGVMIYDINGDHHLDLILKTIHPKSGVIQFIGFLNQTFSVYEDNASSMNSSEKLDINSIEMKGDYDAYFKIEGIGFSLHLGRRVKKILPKFIRTFNENIQNIRRRIVALKQLWGDQIISNALQEVEINFENFLPDANADDRKNFNGKIFVTAGRNPTSWVLDHLDNILIHEAAHNIDTYFHLDSDESFFAESFESLKDKKSLVFSFIVDSYYFEQGRGGHPQKDSGELFASLTNALVEGPSLFQQNLERWQNENREEDFVSLKEDLRTVLKEYQTILISKGLETGEQIDHFIELLD